MNVFLSDEQEEPADLEVLRSIVEGTLRAEGLPAGTEIAVMLVSPDQIAEYNGRFMGKSEPTDVLAFPLVDLVPGEVPPPRLNEPPLALGDVFLCPAEVRVRAERERLDTEAFLFLLLVHGILHLLGYDHHDDEAARRMETREDEILTSLGRPLP